jgi:hypothetical protein
VANDPVEEELRLPIAMVSKSVHFRYHEATESWLGVIRTGYSNLCKIMCMELASLFCHLSLEWKCFVLSWGDRNLMITGSRKGDCWSFGRVPRLRRMGTNIFMTRRVPSSGFSEISSTAIGMTRFRWSGAAAGVTPRARVTTRHAHWDGRTSETSKEGITFGHDVAGAKN